MITIPAAPSPGRTILRRTAAYLLDVVLLFVVLAPAGALVQWALPGDAPRTGPEIWRALLWNFSLPAWAYFAWSDGSRRGATIGKRALGLAVVRRDGDRPGPVRSLLRTAGKLLPWELAHVSVFALSTDPATFTTAQTVGLWTANGVALAWFAVAVATGGRRGVHDLVAGTEVTPARLPA